MKCSDCKWYCQASEGVTEGHEMNDKCHHDRSGHRVGGIREEAKIVFYPCNIMLDGYCRDHKLFEPKGDINV